MLLQLWKIDTFIPIVHRRCRYLISWALDETMLLHTKESLAEAVIISSKKAVAIKTRKKEGDSEKFNYHELLITQNKLTLMQVVLLAKAQHLVQM
jgi:hypothetical protein